ncbi:hypothetical protein LUU34_00950200 [Aix galericulata]|nr:hypothetical protein LUU34_00950200 [Aix galericulata]
MGQRGITQQNLMKRDHHAVDAVMTSVWTSSVVITTGIRTGTRSPSHHRNPVPPGLQPTPPQLGSRVPLATATVLVS